MANSIYLGMVNIKSQVKKLLTKQPHLRDCDNTLVANFWYFELKDQKLDPEKMTAMEFLNLFKEGHLTPSKSIERCRRKLQEQNIDLRGKKYKDRKNEEKDVREKIKDL